MTLILIHSSIESNSGLYEQVSKLKKEVANQKSELTRKQTEIDELHTRLELMADSDKALIDLRSQIKEKDSTILSLRQ